jgi:electron transfer flavoprotein beta subunit
MAQPGGLLTVGATPIGQPQAARQQEPPQRGRIARVTGLTAARGCLSVRSGWSYARVLPAARNVSANDDQEDPVAMKIVVLVKQVPDSGAERNLRADDNTVDRASANNVINEMDEYAIEEALRVRDAHGGEVVVLTMGPERAAESIRKALSMGPDAAVHICDDALHGSCALATSKVLAAAIATQQADLILCGAESTDGRVQAMPHMLAERLGIAALTGARKLSIDGSTLTIERQTDEGYEVVTAATPAVVSVWDTINEPRYPSFKGIMAAKKKPVQTLSLADLAVPATDVGLSGASSAVVEQSKRPPRQGGNKVEDSGDGGAKLVDYLASEKFA